MVLLSTLGNLVHLFFVFSQGNAVEKVPQRYHTTRGCPKKATNRIESLFLGHPVLQIYKNSLQAVLSETPSFRSKESTSQIIRQPHRSFHFYFSELCTFQEADRVKLRGGNPKCTRKKLLVGDSQFLTHRFRVLSVTN